MGLKKKPTKPSDEDYEGMEEEDLEEEDRETPAKPETKKVKRRFMAFQTPPRVGIVDAETDEIIAEGEFANLEVLANILERLERMEATIGSLIE